VDAPELSQYPGATRQARRRVTMMSLPVTEKDRLRPGYPRLRGCRAYV